MTRLASGTSRVLLSVPTSTASTLQWTTEELLTANTNWILDLAAQRGLVTDADGHQEYMLEALPTHRRHTDQGRGVPSCHRPVRRDDVPDPLSRIEARQPLRHGHLRFRRLDQPR